MVAFSVRVVGLQTEKLYISLPVLIVIGIAAAFSLELFMKVSWTFMTSFVNDFVLFRLEHRTELGAFMIGQDVALELLPRSR